HRYRFVVDRLPLYPSALLNQATIKLLQNFFRYRIIRMMWRLGTLPLLLVVLTSVNSVHAETAAFDLSGPRIDVRVTRGDKTLPISQVPNLQPGDRIWLHPDLPEDQSAHYLLVAVFFRGSTNPPPDNWFT